jgi:hypothetical protein
LSPADFIEEYVVLQPFFDPSIPINQSPMYRVSGDLGSPCRFLVDGECSIQTVKPVTCLSFPGKVINSRNPSIFWHHFFPCTKEYSSKNFPYIDELERLYESEGGNVVEGVFRWGLFRDCIAEGRKLKKKEKDIYGRDILVEKEDLLMSELRELIVPKLNGKRIKYQRLMGSSDSFDGEISLNLKAELCDRIEDRLDSLKKSVDESTKEYYRIREKYRI